jgi:hypothetical protein
VQTSDLVVILYETFTLYRQIFTDGRALPADPNPTWLGYSVGKWDGDVLHVDTAGFNGKTWLDFDGHPTTERLHVVERFERHDFATVSSPSSAQIHRFWRANINNLDTLRR